MTQAKPSAALVTLMALEVSLEVTGVVVVDVNVDSIKAIVHPGYEEIMIDLS